MEAMACGLPCIVSNIRGNRDLIELQGGRLFNLFDLNNVREEVREMVNCKGLNSMGKFNFNKVLHCDIAKINMLMKTIYLKN